MGPLDHELNKSRLSTIGFHIPKLGYKVTQIHIPKLGY